MLIPLRTARWLSGPPLVRAAVFTVALLGFVALTRPVRSADPPPADPVAEFRDFLRNDLENLGRLVNENRTTPSKAVKDAIEKAKADADKRFKELSDKITTFNAFANVIELREWESYNTKFAWGEDGLKNIPEDLGKKLEDAANRIVEDKKDPDRLVAMCVLIGEEGSKARELRSSFARMLLKRVRPQVMSLTNSDDPRVRAAAAIALAQIDVQGSAAERVDAAKKVLEKDPGNVASRRAAYRALALPFVEAGARDLYALGSGALPATRDDLTREESQALLRKDGQAVLTLPLLAAGARDPDGEVRLTAVGIWRDIAAMLLEEIKPAPKPGRPMLPESIRAMRATIASFAPLLDEIRKHHGSLLAAASDDDPKVGPEVRLLALASLGDLGKVQDRLNEWNAYFAPPPKEPDKEEQVSRLRPTARAAQQPEKFPKPLPDAGDEGWAALHKVIDRNLSDPHPLIRLAAISVVDNLGKDAAPVPAIKSAVKAAADPNKMVRWTGVRILGRFAPKEPERVVPALVRLIPEQDSDLSLLLADVLTKYGPAAGEAVPYLVEGIKAGDPPVRVAFLKTLPALGDAGAKSIPAVAQLLRPIDPNRGSTPYSPPAFQAHPDDPPQFEDYRVRAAAAETLGRFGPAAKGAVDLLRATMNADDPTVRKAAAEAILRIGGR
jgi:HEAT repeat protein